MNHPEKGEDNDTNITLKTTLFLGFIPLVIAAILYISLSLCINVSRCYSNYHLKKQLTIVRCSKQCLIVSNPSIYDTGEQAVLQMV